MNWQPFTLSRSHNLRVWRLKRHLNKDGYVKNVLGCFIFKQCLQIARSSNLESSARCKRAKAKFLPHADCSTTRGILCQAENADFLRSLSLNIWTGRNNDEKCISFKVERSPCDAACQLSIRHRQLSSEVHGKDIMGDVSLPSLPSTKMRKDDLSTVVAQSVFRLTAF